MLTWQWILVMIGLVLVLGSVAIAILIRRAGLSPAATAELRAIGLDLTRLSGRLHHLAADARVPRSVRWLLIGLALDIQARSIRSLISCQSFDM